MMNPEPTSSPTPNFQTLFESAPGLYLVLTPELKIVAVSEAYLQATLTQREAILGRGLFDVFPDNPDDPAASGVHNLNISLQNVLKNRTSDVMAVQKYDIRRPESEGGGFEEHYWSPMNSPVFGPGGEIIYIIHRVEDVTEFIRLKQLEMEKSKLTDELRTQTMQMEAEIFMRAQEVQKANRRLEKANQELARLYEKTKELDQLKTDFFANISHELRTPLTLIIGPTEKLLASDQLNEIARRDLEVILRNARTLLNHVNDLLDVAKLEAGHMTAQYAETDIAGLVRLVASHFETVAEDKNIGYMLDIAEAVDAQLDVDKFQRVLLNLLSNALKFTPMSGHVRCSLRIDSARDRVILEVADSGPGIRLEQREAAFERFRQLEGGASRRFGGTGLGLAIARDFVQLHGGTISIGDAPEGGALFTVEVPRLAPEGTNMRVALADETTAKEVVHRMSEELHLFAASPKAIPGENGQALVLVVEDNPDMNRFLCESLESEYLIDSAFNGNEGLQKALERKPDLILSDMMMPEMSGAELVRAIRTRSELDSTAVVLLTAKADEELRVTLLREGAQDYVMKPFSVEELRARVGNLVTAKRAGEALRERTTQLSEANKELDAFSYSVSHDLRAPLRAVSGFTNILLKDFAADLPPEAQGYLVSVQKGALKMGQLIEALLTFSRLSRQPLTKRTISPADLVREVLNDLKVEQEDQQVEIHIADLPACEADPTLLRQVFLNLLGNALKYTRKREVVTIEVGFQNGSSPCVYFVKDNGAGFNMEYANKLFGVFQRLHRAEEFEGTGAGLAIVQRIISRHGGRIWAEAALNQGATFYFTLADVWQTGDLPALENN
ncbi:MAG TPA: ATP-binding protein [Anaerolineales bacterium]|nr:ATP-binding protein [Anaerolineales bacterium]